MMVDMNSLDFWRNPTGVVIPNDPLKFLYVTDDAEHRMVSWLAARFFEYQQRHLGTEREISKMVMITMGALLPGVLLQDYITHCAPPDLPKVEFGTFGVRCYLGPGQPLEHPEVVQPLSIDVRGQTVGIVEDLIDLGETTRFVHDCLCSPYCGARSTLIIAPYRKSSPAWLEGQEFIIFGNCPKDTWIIMPRERVETMVKRVPTWVQSGADKDECIRRLRVIGYPDYLIDDWFETAWERAL